METKNKAALIVASHTTLDLQQYNNDDYFIVGVEQGAVELINQNIKLDLAIGDFDHVTSDELELIASKAIIFQQMNPEKDELDGQSALDFVQAEGYYPIKFLVQSTSRFDMNLSIMGLIKEYDHLEVFNEFTMIKKLPAGINEINYEPSEYVSFYTLVDNNKITLKNFYYNVKNYKAKIFSTYFVSNKFVENQNGIIENEFDVVIIITK